jgi:hypothetical protein
MTDRKRKAVVTKRSSWLRRMQSGWEHKMCGLRAVGNLAGSSADRLMVAEFLAVEVRHYVPAEQLHAPEHIAM